MDEDDDEEEESASECVSMIIICGTFSILSSNAICNYSWPQSIYFVARAHKKLVWGKIVTFTATT